MALRSLQSCDSGISLFVLILLSVYLVYHTLETQLRAQVTMEKDFLKKLTEITEANLSNPQFGVNELAREMNMSRSSLFRRLNSINGKSISQFIREVRLWRSRELLQEEGMTASEAAHQTGFSSPAYFSNCFHEYFGYPPGEVKKNMLKGTDENTRPVYSEGVDKDGPIEVERATASLPEKLPAGKRRTGQIVFIAATGFMIVLFCVIFFSIISGSEKLPGDRLKSNSKSIAVLPFTDWGTKPADPWIIYGFKKELIRHLAEVRSLLVKSEISTESYRNTKKPIQTIGKELDADYLISGSFGFVGDQLKIFITLTETKIDRVLGTSDTIWKPGNDFFGALSEITKIIADQLKAKLTPEEIRQIDKKPTDNQEANAQYLLGRYYLDGNRGFQNLAAMEAFHKAFDLDPRFADAYLGYARAYIVSHILDLASYQESVPIITWAIGKAREVDPDNPDIGGTLAYFQRSFRKNGEALEYYKKLVKDDPGNSGGHFFLGMIYRSLGNWDKARDYLVKAVDLYQKNSSYIFNAGLTFDMLREYPEAIKYYDQLSGFNPRHSFPYLWKSDIVIKTEGDTRKASQILTDATLKNTYDGWDMMAFHYRQIWIDFYEGNYDRALAHLTPLNKIQGFFPTPNGLQPLALMYAMTYGFLDRPDLERNYWDSTRFWVMQKDTTYPNDPRSMSMLGIAWAGLGYPERAVELGEKAVEISPQCQNPILESYIIENLAYIYTRVGKYPEAIKQLRHLLSVPSRMTPKLLEIDPRWIPLRNLTGFKELLKY